MNAKVRHQLSAKVGVTTPEPLQTWLDRVSTIPELAGATEGIYCGRDGRISEPLDFGRCSLVMGWHEGKVEYAYVA